MGTKTSLSTTTFAASHTAAATKAGRSPVEQNATAQQQAQDLIVTLKEMIKDMQSGDANITAFQTLITNLS
jgi:hypothetical protein